MKKLIILLAVAGALTGCANLKFAWSASYQTDNLLADLQQSRQVDADRAAAALVAARNEAATK